MIGSTEVRIRKNASIFQETFEFMPDLSSSSAIASLRSVGFDVAAFDSFLAGRSDPDWVIDLRRKAFEVYREKLTAPLNPEEWKRVDLRALQPQKFAIAAETGPHARFETLLE